MDKLTEITATEAAEIIGVSAHHVGWYYAKGLLPGRRMGKRMLVFRRADVESFEKPKKTGRPRKAMPTNGKRAKPAAEAAPAAPEAKKQRGRPKGKSKT